MRQEAMDENEIKELGEYIRDRTAEGVSLEAIAWELKAEPEELQAEIADSWQLARYLAHGKGLAVSKVEQALFKKASQGNFNAIELWLKHNHSDKYDLDKRLRAVEIDNKQATLEIAKAKLDKPNEVDNVARFTDMLEEALRDDKTLHD